MSKRQVRRKKLGIIDEHEDEEIFLKRKSNSKIQDDLESRSFSLFGNSDWSQPELLKFPKLEMQLIKEKHRHREMFKDIVTKLQSRHVDNVSDKLRKYDVEINLNRILYRKDQYIGLLRNKRKQENIFSNVILHKLERNKDNVEALNKSDLFVNSDGNDFASSLTNSCPRFTYHTKIYDEKYLKSVFEPPTLKVRSKLGKYVDKQKQETDFDDLESIYVTKPKVETTTDIEQENENNKPSTETVNIQIEQKENNEDYTQRFASDSLTSMKSVKSIKSTKNLKLVLPVIKPKHEIVKAKFKDPLKIHNKKSRETEFIEAVKDINLPKVS